MTRTKVSINLVHYSCIIVFFAAVSQSFFIISLFGIYFLITTDDILIPRICCVFVYLLYAYLCFIHKKNKTFHHEPIFSPLGLYTAPVTMKALSYAVFPILLSVVIGQGRLWKQILWNQASLQDKLPNLTACKFILLKKW